MDTSDFTIIIPLLKDLGVVSAGVFGSVARGEGTTKSDIDILVEFSKPVGLLKFVRLERDLSNKLKRPVDLVTRRSLSPYIEKNVLSDLQIFYEKR